MKNSLCLLFFVLLLSNCQTHEHKQQKKQIPQVETAIVQQVAVSDPVRAAGTIHTAQNLKRSFKIGGIIECVQVDEGDLVQKGDLLARLNTSEIDAKAQQAELGLKKAKRDFRRIDNLYKDSVATREQWQNAQTALEAARADWQIASFNRRHAQLQASRDGVVLKRLAEPGEMIAAGYPVLVVGTRDRQYQVHVAITDREWVQLQFGDSAIVQLDAYPGQRFSAQVSLKSAVSDPATGTYKVNLTFGREPAEIATGMMASVRIFPGKKEKSLRIPVDALLEGAGKTGYVYVVENQKIERKHIAIEKVGTRFLYIRSGVKKGQQIVTRGKNYVTNGQQVEVIHQN